ncbi:MAG: gliding motility lipoprotein GldD [Paludibacteraceae bacterium]|nr:gliding motility lipoprotein GldD [Paludibacteraceae bacterium]
MKTLNKIIGLSLAALVLTACSHPIPKPKGYFRIELKEKNYERYNEPVPYSFEYAHNVSRVVRQNDNEDWFDIAYPLYNARIYCSYMPVKNNLYEVIEDAREFVYKHTIKADAITEQPFENPDEQVYGILYEIKGNTASSIQFVLTDSTRHYLRGALYFNNKPNKDSLAPVIAYMKEDIVHLMETTQWK